MSAFLARVLAALAAFFGPVANSIKGKISGTELVRSVLTSLGSGTLAGVVILVLQGVLTNVTAVFPDPTVATIATSALSLVIDLIRRSGHGTVTPSAS